MNICLIVIYESLFYHRKKKIDILNSISKSILNISQTRLNIFQDYKYYKFIIDFFNCHFCVLNLKLVINQIDLSDEIPIDCYNEIKKFFY